MCTPGLVIAQASEKFLKSSATCLVHFPLGILSYCPKLAHICPEKQQFVLGSLKAECNPAKQV